MRTASAISMAYLAIGCVSVDVARLDDIPRPQGSPESVLVLSEEPDRPHTVIAVIESKTGAVYQGFDDLRQKLIVEAAALGGDAIILGVEGKESTMLITATGQIHSEEKKLTAKVIVFPRL